MCVRCSKYHLTHTPLIYVYSLLSYVNQTSYMSHIFCVLEQGKRGILHAIIRMWHLMQIPINTYSMGVCVCVWVVWVCYVHFYSDLEGCEEQRDDATMSKIPYGVCWGMVNSRRDWMNVMQSKCSDSGWNIMLAII